MKMSMLDKYRLVFKLGIVLLIFYSTQGIAKELFLDTIEVEIKFAERIFFKPTFGPIDPEDEETYDGVLFGVQPVDMDLWDRLMGMTNRPVLVIGNEFRYPIMGSLGLVDEQGFPRARIILFHIKNVEQIPEGEEVFLYMVSGALMREEYIERNHARFSHDIIFDNRWLVISGNLEDSQGNRVPYATMKVTGGNTSFTTVIDGNGWFSFVKGKGNQREAFRVEKDTTYVVEVLANEVVLLSKTFTQETAAYPRWYLKLDTTVDYYQIQGYVYDNQGHPLPEVTVTVDEYHTATTDENGHYQITYLFAGDYTLMASKTGYNFTPIEFTVGEGELDPINIVASSPTRCLLYAVHDTANNKGQLFSADLSEEPFEVKPVNLTLPSHEVSIAVADFDDDDEDEIAVAAQQGGHTVTLYELDGTRIRSFPVQASGISLAAGNMDGDNQPGIIVASRAANRDRVFVYAADGTAQGSIVLFDKNTRMAPAVGDIDGDNQVDIIAGRLLKEDQVAVYNLTSHALSHFSVFQSRTRKKDDNAGKANGPRYGVNVASADFNDDGKADVVAAMASNGSQVEVYESDGTLLSTLAAFDNQHGVVRPAT